MFLDWNTTTHNNKKKKKNRIFDETNYEPGLLTIIVVAQVQDVDRRDLSVLNYNGILRC